MIHAKANTDAERRKAIREADPAFPFVFNPKESFYVTAGMSRRFYAATQVLAALALDCINGAEDAEDSARCAWKFADALLATENEKPE